MARIIRTIEAVASSTGMEVDRNAGIIHGVKILGLVSDNNRKYMPEAVRKAKSLYEGIKVNIDHPAESGDVRSAEDRFGKLINVEYVEGEGLYGDLMFLKSHPMAERICEAAERNDMNDTFGLSHNAQGDGQEDDDGCFVVNSIVEVRHVDLVADPATTKSLREARIMEADFSNVGKTSREWDAHFEKQSPKMQSAINVGLHRGLSYPDAAKRARSLVKEAIANNEDVFVCKIYKDFGGPYGKTGPKTIKEQSVSGSKEKAIAWVKSQLKATSIKDDEQGKDYTIFGVVLRKGSGAIVAKYEKSESSSSIITHAESKMKEAKATNSDYERVKKTVADALNKLATIASKAKSLQVPGNKLASIYTAFASAASKLVTSPAITAFTQIKTVEESILESSSEADIRLPRNEYSTLLMQLADASGKLNGLALDLRHLPQKDKIIMTAKNAINKFIGSKASDDFLLSHRIPIEEAKSMRAHMKEATDFDAIKKFQDTLKNATTKQVLAYHIGNTGGKIKSKDYTASEVGGKQAMIGDILRSKFGSKAVEEFFAQEKSSTTKRTKESDMRDDKDEEMTEAEDMPVEDPSEEQEMTEANEIATSIWKLEKQFENAVKELHSINAGISGFIKSDNAGPKTKQKFTQIRSDLSNAINVANKVKTELAYMLHPKADGSDSFSEAEGDPEDDMPIEDSSEEEMTEAASETDTARKLLAKAYDLARSGKVFDAAQELIGISTGKSGITSARIKSLAKRIASELIPLSSDLDRIRADLKQYSTSIEESEGDSEDDMPMDEADGMSIDDITDKPAIEAYDEEDNMPMNEANDDKKKKEPGVEVYGTKGMKNTRFRLKFKTQKDYEKWYDKNQDDVNIEGLRDLEEQEDDIPMDEADDEEDKMAMESKQYRKLQQFCKKNNMVLTRDLYKDLRPLSESAQQRCILRIKLASKARKPRSSGSMMPMTESKVYTGDNVFNWLRS